MSNFSRRILWILFLGLTAFAFVRCNSNVPVVQPTATATATSTSVSTSVSTAPTTCVSGQWCYDYLITPKFIKSMSGADFTSICKTHAVDPAKLWSAMEQGITWAESDWNPSNTYTEDFIDAYTKLPAVSIGLYQLSVGDPLNYPNSSCAGATTESLKTPVFNMNCGLDIQATLVSKYPGDVLTSLGKYWSVLRPTVWSKTQNKNVPNSRHQIFLDKFYSIVKECK